MAKFKVGDYAKSKERAYLDKGRIVDELEGNEYVVKFAKGVEDIFEERDLVAANSLSRNAKFKVGDKVKYWVFDKKVTGTIKAIRGDKAEVVAVGDKTGITYPIKDLVAANSVCSRNAVVAKALNACARNASASPALRKAYDEWKKAEEKFKKWWNPDRRLSERPPAGADSASRATAFSNLFLKEIGRRPPNGYGNMTLEQMLASNACGTARNASGHKVKVTIKSITDKGIQTFEKIVDVNGLESWMRSAGLGGEYQHVLKQLTAMGVNEVSLSAMSKVMIADV